MRAPAGMDEGLDLLPPTLHLPAQAEFLRTFCRECPERDYMDAVRAVPWPSEVVSLKEPTRRRPPHGAGPAGAARHAARPRAYPALLEVAVMVPPEVMVVAMMVMVVTPVMVVARPPVVVMAMMMVVTRPPMVVAVMMVTMTPVLHRLHRRGLGEATIGGADQQGCRLRGSQLDCNSQDCGGKVPNKA